METFFSGTVTVLVTVTVTVEHHFFFFFNFWKIGGFGFNRFLACTVQVWLSQEERIGYSLYL